MEGRLGFRGPLHASLLGLVAAVLVIVGLLGMHGLASGGLQPHTAQASAAVPCAAEAECAAPAPCAAEARAGMCIPLPPKGHAGPSLPATGHPSVLLAAAGRGAAAHRSPPPAPPSLHELSVLRI